MHVKKLYLTKTFWAAGGVLVLTMIHHIYGAIIYDTPFRLEITYYAIPVLLLIILTYIISLRRLATLPGKIAFWVFIIVTFLIPVFVFGIIEGGYNHLVKNILYFSGAAESVFDRLYTSPVFELPNDFWFEATGILQLFAGLYTAYYLIKLVRSKNQTLHN